MRIDNNKIDEAMQAKIIAGINEAEDKGQAIAEAVETIVSMKYADFTEQFIREAEQAEANAELKKTMGIRTHFTKEETEFFTAIKRGARQTLTADQIDIIPSVVLDHTLDDVRKDYPILDLIEFAPANVKRWLTGSKSGTAAWGSLIGTISSELSATLTSINLEVGKLAAFCLIPKGVRDLEIGYVEKYFRAILEEAMYNGIVAGYISGTGKEQPIGILKKVDDFNSDGTAKSKTKVSTLTGFSPAQLSPVITALSNGGTRAVGQLYLIANPADVAGYVNPALYGDSISGGYVSKSFMPITVISEPQMAQGTAAITMKGYYTMGFSGLKVDEYKETKAIEDCDLLIAKVYGNGRAYDNNTAYVFDPEELIPYIPTVQTVSNP